MTKKVAVVTGCAGFIGSTFVRKLLEDKWYVYGIDAFTNAANTLVTQETMSAYPDRYTVLQANITTITSIPDCDVLFNFAAETDVDNGNDNCALFIQSNIDGVRNLLSIIKKKNSIKTDKPLFVQISTDEVYGDSVTGTFDENALILPSNPYAATKAAADLLIQSWSRTHDIDYIIIRPSNNYGPNQYYEKLIPLTVRNLDRGKKIKLHNKGTPIRTWTHVEDTIDAIKLIAEKGAINSIYNVSSGFEQCNYDTVTKIISAFFMGRLSIKVPKLEEHLDLTYNRPGQDVRYSISCDPLKDLGWSPKKEFDKEIVSLVNKFKKEFKW